MRTNRQEFDKATKEAAWARSKGCCEYCHQPFAGRRPDYHHHIPAALFGDNSLGNCRCICKPCHRLVTDEEDVPRITKAKRTYENQANVRAPKQKIQSRGFERKWAS